MRRMAQKDNGLKYYETRNSLAKNCLRNGVLTYTSTFKEEYNFTFSYRVVTVGFADVVPGPGRI